MGEDSFLEQADGAVVSVEVALRGPTSPSPEHKVWPGGAGRASDRKSRHPWAAFIPLTCPTGERRAVPGWGEGVGPFYSLHIFKPFEKVLILQ